jgi:hypothetical protein
VELHGGANSHFRFASVVVDHQAARNFRSGLRATVSYFGSETVPVEY